MEDLVSIITPTYNSGNFIIETFASVQAQSYSNWEMIVVDDCSSDTTRDILLDFQKKDKRIKPFFLDKNQGSGVARNYALQQSTGRYIAFLDADDLWFPNKLEVQIDFLKQNSLPMTYSYFECINEQGLSLNRLVKAPLKMKYWTLFFCNYVGNLTGIYDVNYYGKIPITSIRKRQDWILWLTLLKKTTEFNIVPQSLAYYRVRENSISSSKIKLIKDNYNVYRQYHKLPIVVAILCMAVFLGYHFTFKKIYVDNHYIKD